MRRIEDDAGGVLAKITSDHRKCLVADPPRYSDPIVIPITITIPDLRPPPATDRWGQLRPAIHPSVDDPGWFQRQAASAARNLANLEKMLEWPSVGSLSWGLSNPLGEMGRRAGRRGAYARGEIEQGDFGSAAGHLLLGKPFPADVDDPLGPFMHSEAPEEGAKDPPKRNAELDAKTAGLEDDMKKR